MWESSYFSKDEEETRVSRRLGEFDSILRAIEFLIPHDKYAIIGGMSVELWRRRFTPNEPEIKSHDLDACSRPSLEYAQKITEYLGGLRDPKYFQNANIDIAVHKIFAHPDTGKVEDLKKDGLLLEVVDPFAYVSVFDKPSEGIVERIPYGNPPEINVMDPLSVCYAKFMIRVADNAKPWGDHKSFTDRDWNHMASLAKIIPHYLKDATARYQAGTLKKNPAILANRLKKLFGDEQEIYNVLFSEKEKMELGAALGTCLKTLGDPQTTSFSGDEAFTIGR